jgi:pimeloyl-ACP methyl ester carboxylesterase
MASLTVPSGLRLDYREQGEPGGVPVLLLHGVTDSRRSWDPVLPHLPRSIRAIALTQRGHGDSDRPRDVGYAIDDMAAELASVGSPVLLVWGDRDVFDTRGEQDWIVETIEGARLEVYQGTGHAVHWEEPERFAADVAAFATAHASRGATVAP